MTTTRSLRRQVRFGLAGSLVAGGLVLGVPAAHADTPSPVFVTVAAPLPVSFCGGSFCYATVTGSWTVTPFRLPTISATLRPI